MKEPRERTAAFFDTYASEFSAIYGSRPSAGSGIINRLFRRSMMLRFLRTLEECMPISGRSVLDVGCGPGHYSVELARRGAAAVTGIDFAPGMIELARQRARALDLEGRCTFQQVGLREFVSNQKFDYAVVMGFMDYIAPARETVEKVLSVTGGKALFSFPFSGDALAWQRKLRYRRRCDLFFYSRDDVQRLFAKLPCESIEVRRLARDLFVTVTMKS